VGTDEGRSSAVAEQRPRYHEIADELRRQIESGELPRESQLATEVELQKRFSASRNTVRDAVKVLVAERLLETRGREGTFVTKAHVPFVTTLSTDPNTGISGIGEEGSTYPALVLQQDRQNAGAGDPKVEVLECPPQIAARLGTDEGEYVVSRHQERYIEDTVWSLQTSYYPMKWVELGAARLLIPKDIPEGAVEYLSSTTKLRQNSYRDLLWARQPNDKEKTLFNLTINHMVIEVYRTSFAENGTPIRVTVTVYPADRNQIVYDIGDVPQHQEEPVRLERPGSTGIVD
jgi:GntR family transcriptional regulator